MRSIPVSLALLCGPPTGFSAAAASEGSAPPRDAEEFFEKQIRPILVEHCYECHSADSDILQGGLQLDTAQGLRDGGDSGPAIDGEELEESLLLAALKYESYEMPPEGQLPAEVIDDFARWLRMGAPDPRQSAESPVHVRVGELVDQTPHWSFQPLHPQTPPDVGASEWPRSDVDRFVLAKLAEAGIAPSAQAAPRELLRRLYYDLTGLPPSADQLDDFAAAPTDEAYAKAVDALLASPRFGERWGRHWLDVARYADTKGYVFEEDRKYPGAYKYRDWVIESFNDDLPFNQFAIAQLAADQLDDPAMQPAMGYLTLGRRFLNNPHDIIDDRIDVVSRGMMGLTVACARCHDHKYDPIPTADYYALYGVFASSKEEQHEDRPWMLVDNEQPSDAAILLRGNPSSRGEIVKRRFLSCLSLDQPPEPFHDGSGRLELAKSIASSDNPLTARVWVNRVWTHLFGRGIVTTQSDFGTRGEPPTHPQLLDWLADELTSNEWSSKQLIRKLVLSSVYRQSSDERSECVAVDPENRFWWHANRRRLDLESLRDSLLAASGQLDESMGGPSVSLTEAPFSKRRSVYGYIERQNLPSFFRTFDFASPNAHTPERPQTVSPQQALFLMNSPLVMQLAGELAQRSQCAVGEDQCRSVQRARIEALFRLALGRSPTDDEVRQSQEFVSPGEDDDHDREKSIAGRWRFGWGRYDDAASEVQFHPLPHFAGDQWQGGPEVPDETLGWALLTASGGHPGNPEHNVIRRFTAPRSGRARVVGRLDHPSENGDGVRARIIASRQGQLGEWTATHGSTETSTDDFEIERGDVIDLLVDCRESESHDSFRWEATIKLVSAAVGDEQTAPQAQSFATAAGFHGPVEPPLSRWDQLGQVLLMSNEFAFVD